MKMRSKRSEVKSCLLGKNVTFCLLDSVREMVTIPGLDNPRDTQDLTRAWINAQGTMKTPVRTRYPIAHYDSRKVTHTRHQSKLTNARSSATEAFTWHKCCQRGKVSAREQRYRRQAPFWPLRNKSLRVDSHK